ncbi:response regulator transcription factor [Lysobacter changpingensis]|uniref:response regulator transcription factor n=1 Tax=Lysobacter changpingensis TaxID=2792784 RepID=UPI002A4E174D|nr:response regulator transcription factor [Lysobacter changpingensis]
MRERRHEKQQQACETTEPHARCMHEGTGISYPPKATSSGGRSCMNLRVFLADDHPVVLRGARVILEASGIAVVGEARSSDELLAALENTPCDVVVTDFAMPNSASPDGAEMIRQLRERHPLLPIVVMTMIGNVGILDSLLRAAVLGVVEKTEDMEILPMAVKSAANRRVFISPGLRRQLDAIGKRRGRGTLSAREAEIIRLLASGLTVTEIAQQLDRSLKTISRQKIDAMRKLGLENEAELYAYARENGLA